MRRALMLVPIFVALLLSADILQACGDKFFLVGRGERFSRAYASLHPGNILLYTGGTSEISKGLANARLHRFLDRAGHRVLLAADRAELEQVLASEAVDVILADLGQAIDLVPQAVSAPSRPTLLPIEGGDAAGRAASQDQFPARLKSSDKINRFLAGIEDVMKARAPGNAPRS